MRSEFPRSDINLLNWRDRPYNTWSFQNVSEFIPSAPVRGARMKEDAPKSLGKFAEVKIPDPDIGEIFLPALLEASQTDALVVIRHGEIIAEWYAPHTDPFRPHLLFSVSKSFAGLLVGILEDEGKLDLDDLIVRYIPDAAGSAYGDATVRDLVNMTLSLEFDESYLGQTGDFGRYRRAMLWSPDQPGLPAQTLRELLCSLRRAGHPHGTRHAYRSPNSDMAGLVIEAASGLRFADLLSQKLWLPMGARTDAAITVDRAGNPRPSGGISASARDLARLGDLILHGGRGIIPARFIENLWSGGDRQLWATGDQSDLFAGGSYRCYWYETGTGALAAMGNYGQNLWIDRVSGTIVVRLSSQYDPVDKVLDHKMIAAFKILSAHK